jgi:hypothetical protein
MSLNSHPPVGYNSDIQMKISYIYCCLLESKPVHGLSESFATFTFGVKEDRVP